MWEFKLVLRSSPFGPARRGLISGSKLPYKFWAAKFQVSHNLIKACFYFIAAVNKPFYELQESWIINIYLLFIVTVTLRETAESHPVFWFNIVQSCLHHKLCLLRDVHIYVKLLSAVVIIYPGWHDDKVLECWNSSFSMLRLHYSWSPAARMRHDVGHYICLYYIHLNAAAALLHQCTSVMYMLISLSTCFLLLIMTDAFHLNLFTQPSSVQV